MIPDAVFEVAGVTLALEYDRGFENTKFFATTKMTAYRHGFNELPLSGVLVAADSEARLNALRRAVGDDRIMYRTIEEIRRAGLPRSLKGIGSESKVVRRD